MASQGSVIMVQAGLPTERRRHTMSYRKLKQAPACSKSSLEYKSHETR